MIWGVVMYDMDGAFGKVRMAYPVNSPQEKEQLFCMDCVGWHRCNSAYHILRERGTPCWLLLVTIDGTGCLRMNGKEYSLTAGTVALIPSMTPCEYFTPEEHEWEFYWMHPEGIPASSLLWYASEEGGVEFCENYKDMGKKMEELMLHFRISQRFQPEASQHISNLLHEVALLFVPGTEDARKVSHLAQDVVTYLELHYQSDILLKDISEKFYISPTHLVRMVKKLTGYTPHEYLIRYRVAKAAHLLAGTDKTVAEIAREVGFRQTSNFIQQFKAVKGYTPNSGRSRK